MGLGPDNSEWKNPSNANFIPTAAKEPFFDPARKAWVLSRYVDVLTALRNRGLVQASSRGGELPDGTTRAGLISALKAEMGKLQSGSYRATLESEARSVIRNLADHERIDLLGDVALPWSVRVLQKMSGDGSASSAANTIRLAAALLYKKAFSLNLDEETKPLWIRTADARAQNEDPEVALDVLIERHEIVVSKSMFLAVTQSLSAYLAKSWLALVSNPAQMDLLSSQPDKLSHAETELLRYSGIVHSLYRKATKDLRIGRAQIAKGDLVELRIAAANFDSDIFPVASRLDITRSPQLQLSLGAGPHTCPGSFLVRQAFEAATSVLLQAKPRLVPNQRIVWMGDSTLRWPLAVWVTLEQQLR